MPILVVCPQCGHTADKMALSEIARRDALFRCPSCGTICTEPTVAAPGDIVRLDDRQETLTSSAASHNVEH
jgi:uncharacterized Zn finger protein